MVIRARSASDTDWHGGDYDPEKPPARWLETAMPLIAMMTSDADRLQHAAPTRADAVALFDRVVAGAQELHNDFLYAFESSTTTIRRRLGEDQRAAARDQLPTI